MSELKIDVITCGYGARAVTKAVETVSRDERALVNVTAGGVRGDGGVDAITVRRAAKDTNKHDLRETA
ncbi:heavy metal transporter [Azospirillum sp. YIM DDC1]|uniref:Heavy metal transporter n=1 Tax=Azospirillum aestuarii TaxID=2802052 RepID=A0ABS1I6K1_9PROT|nr:heavy metal transporter [Azospirillum aestuarii]MBK4722695.1 heavy metal transporter [Azospirillum aestuarii]